MESVLIPERNHYTLCVSSQVGCAQGCKFCCTAGGGFIRNLTAGEIVAQVRDLVRETEGGPEDPMRLTNIVFMGMGEPLANYDNLLKALKIIVEGRLRVPVRIAPGHRFHGWSGPENRAAGKRFAGQSGRFIERDRQRNPQPPDARSTGNIPLEQLVAACRSYPLNSKRRITFEYILIKGVNDSKADAERLADLLKPVRAKINLIPFNEFTGLRVQAPGRFRSDPFPENSDGPVLHDHRAPQQGLRHLGRVRAIAG